MVEKITGREHDPWKVISYPLLTEKGISGIESENKLMFIVKQDANKTQIRWAVETALGVKVDSINTLVDRDGAKKAMVKLKPEFKASDIATRFGML
jgi:large subunit ribosomal protein L23